MRLKTGEGMGLVVEIGNAVFNFGPMKRVKVFFCLCVFLFSFSQ